MYGNFALAAFVKRLTLGYSACVLPIVIVGAVALTGYAADAQDWDCSDPGNLPQQGMNYCAYEDYKSADADLNFAYKRARDAMRQTDENLPQTQRGAADSLLRAQRAWITYRDAACETEGFSFRGGSMEPFIVASCKAQLTRQRTQALRSLSETF